MNQNEKRLFYSLGNDSHVLPNVNYLAKVRNREEVMVAKEELKHEA